LDEKNPGFVCWSIIEAENGEKLDAVQIITTL
jgi:hypothetical protein